MRWIVEGASAEVVNDESAVHFLLEAIGERRRCRLIQQAQHFEACNARGIFGRLSLRIIKVRRHGDHHATDLTNLILGALFELTQNLRAHLDRRHLTRTARNTEAHDGAFF